VDVSKKVSLLDDEFANYMETLDETRFCKNVGSILGSLSNGKLFKINIIYIRNYGQEPFFGMRIFPRRSAIMSYISSITRSSDEIKSLKNLCDRWKNITDWDIEIDSRIFDRNMINFNPQEMTAMLLHEIGHTVYSDKKIEMFCRVYRDCRLRLSSADKEGAKAVYTLYLIPLTLLCGMREWKVTSIDLREEMFADQSVQKLGYGEHLISAYSKIIKTCGSNGYQTETHMENELETSMDWCNLNVKDLARRKEKLKDELYSTGKHTYSIYIKEMIQDIMNKLEIRKIEKYTGNVVLESSLTIDFSDNEFLDTYRLYYDMKKFSNMERNWHSLRDCAQRAIATEAFGKKKKDEIPSQLDVDTIFVEVDRIQNHADRRYVLDLIYTQEEKIEHFLELCEYNNELKDKYYGKMQSMLKELESMRQAVLAKRNFDKQYRVFVKYPAGYEG